MNHCGDTVTCPGGNCVGCADGETWCHDPRCAPHCRDCKLPPHHDTLANFVFAFLVGSLVLLLIIVWFAWGPTVARPVEIFHS